MLHIVNKSHAETSSLQSCLRLAKAGSALLLIEDAVYAATVAGAAGSGIADAMKTLKVYALQPDVEARGMAGKLVDGVTAVDYAGFQAALQGGIPRASKPADGRVRIGYAGALNEKIDFDLLAGIAERRPECRSSKKTGS